MRNRREKRTAPPPNPSLIRTYLQDAQPDSVRALHALWCQWKAEVTKETREVEAEKQLRDEAPAACIAIRFESPEVEAARRVRERWMTLGAPSLFDHLLRGFFDRAGHVIFASPDPLAAMRNFWEGKPRRGRHKESNAERDRNLRAAVEERVNSGETNEEAIAAVAETVSMPYDTVHKIYYRNCLEVRAVLELQALMRNAEQ